MLLMKSIQLNHKSIEHLISQATSWTSYTQPGI